MEKQPKTALQVIKKKPTLDISIKGNTQIPLGKQPAWRSLVKDIKDKIWWNVEYHAYHQEDRLIDLAQVVEFIQSLQIRINIETGRKQTGTYITYADVEVSNPSYHYDMDFDHVLDIHNNEQFFLFLNFDEATDFIKDFDYKRSEYKMLIEDQFDDTNILDITSEIVENAITFLVEQIEENE